MTGGEDSAGAIRLLAINPTLRAELVRVQPFLEDRRQPMTREAMLARIVTAAPTYGIPQREPGEWAAVWGAYLDALEGLSEEALNDAFVRWDRGEGYPDEPKMHTFMPKPADLFRLAQRSRLELGTAAYRARKALEYVEKKRTDVTPEQRAADRQKLIDEGLMVEGPDGKLRANFTLNKTPLPPGRVAVGETPKELAARLRAQADKAEPEEGV